MRQRRRTAGRLVSVVAVIAAASLVVIPNASASVTDVGGLGIFELDGNTAASVATPGVDWESLFTSTGADVNPAPTLPNADMLQSTFEPDFTQPDSSYFASNGGGVKDIAPINSWGCKSQSQPTPKDDLFNAYAMMAQVNKPGDPRNGHLILYLGSERQQNQGDAFAGFWINQNEITCDLANGAFLNDADHIRKNGDLLVVADYKSGGAVQQLAAYEWTAGSTTSTSASNITPLVVNAGSNLADCTQVATTANLCATTNGTGITPPWPPSGGRTAGTFVEAGLDLTAIYAAHSPPQEVPCFSQLFAETRSSESPTATLKDFSEDSFETCRAPDVSTELFKDNAPAGPGAEDTSLKAPASHTVTLPANVYDTGAISGASGTLTGTVNYSVWTDSTCTTASTGPLFSHGADPSTNVTDDLAIVGGVIPSSPVLTYDQPGSFWYKMNYSGGGRNQASESDCATEPLVVQKASPAIATTASDGGTIGVTIHDDAVVSGGYFPATAPADGYGSVTFSLYGPYAANVTPTCAAADQIDLAPGDSGTKNEVVTATRDALDNANNTKVKASSSGYKPTAVGTYQWVASYGGNSQNNSATATLCSDTAEDVVIGPATPGIATTISISDKVKVTGNADAGAIAGNVTFTLYQVALGTSVTSATCVDANKVAAAVYSPQTLAVNGSGEASTSSVSVSSDGNYAWGVVFTPSAGSNYTGATSSCEKEVAGIDYTSPSPIP